MIEVLNTGAVITSEQRANTGPHLSGQQPTDFEIMSSTCTSGGSCIAERDACPNVGTFILDGTKATWFFEARELDAHNPSTWNTMRTLKFAFKTGFGHDFIQCVKPACAIFWIMG